LAWTLDLHYLTLLSKYWIFIGFFKEWILFVFGFRTKKGRFSGNGFFCWFLKGSDQSRFMLVYRISLAFMDIYRLFDDSKLLIIPGLWKLIRSTA